MDPGSDRACSVSSVAAAVPAPSGDVVVSVRNLGKCYRIYDKPSDRLKQAMWRWRRQFYREFWALRHVSLEVRRGEAVGIIGRNGSGKSTLLQIIAGTLSPTEGQVTTRGRIAALLELGSGFNPDFTGRENVFLNGAILGLSTDEIEDRFDEIAAFADIGEFIDRPVQTYSTGMLLRLAFAVQAIIQPEVLVIDEALAVGDTAFQIKCMKRMENLLARGTSVLLVTHDVNTVRTFCHRAVWLEQGRVERSGEPREVTSRYLEFVLGNGQARTAANEPGSPQRVRFPGGADGATGPGQPLWPIEARRDLIRWGSGEVRIDGVSMNAEHGKTALVFDYGDRLYLEMEVRAAQEVDSADIGVGFAFRNAKGLDIITFTTWDAGHRIGPLRAGATVRLRFEVQNILAPGEYALVLNVEDVRGSARHYFDFIENALLFRVVGSRRVFSCVLPPVRCETVRPTAAERGS